MRKFFSEALVLSFIIGVMIRAIALLVMGESLFTNVENYFYSAGIAMVSCSLTFIVHVKVLTNSEYSFIEKYIVSSLLITVIYVMSNVYVGGWSLLLQLEFYGYALAIIILSLPLVFQLNRRMMRFQNYLHLKKSRKVWSR